MRRPARKHSGAAPPKSRHALRKRALQFGKEHPVFGRHKDADSLESLVLASIDRQEGAVSLADIAADLDLGRAGSKGLVRLLADLCQQQVLVCADKHYTINKASLVEGVVEMHPRGFGFALLGGENNSLVQRSKQDLRQDPFISPSSFGGANHGDRVLFRVLTGSRGRPEARVVRVLEHVVTNLVGTYTAKGKAGFVTPFDSRYGFKVKVAKPQSCGAQTGEAVTVAITRFQGNENSEGRIVEVLGDPAGIGVQTEMVIRKYALPHTFSAQALQFAEQLPEEIPAEADRKDLCKIDHVTIDGETARDFDDAVAMIRSKKGYRLYVSIADVSHYVRPGTVLDREAYERGTSVYFTDRVVPMLPERLSNNLCSLVPGRERAAFTAVLDFDANGKRTGKQFFKSRIKSRFRLTYTEVKSMLADQNPELRKKYSAVLEPLEQMAELALLLEKSRTARGSIGFSIPEAVVELDGKGGIKAVNRSVQNMAHKLIEEFMLAANEAVAETLAENRRPTLYRIHEKPDILKVEEFVAFARVLGVTVSGGQGKPEWFGRVLDAVRNTPREYIVSNLLLRTMQRARYTDKNVGHFGLAATYYTHFTSPIRRYPDLIVHRVLGELIAAQGTAARKKSAQQPAADDLEKTGDFLSSRERKAVEAEREMTKILQARFMSEKIGEEFDGIISGVSSFGCFVELVEHFVSGVVAITDLPGDYYYVDEKSHRLVGKHTNRIFQLGDKIRIRVARVDVDERQIHFLALEVQE